jgi:hypothetical protein
MNSASLCSLAGRYDYPIPPRFLAPIDFLKIPALKEVGEVGWGLGGGKEGGKGKGGRGEGGRNEEAGGWMGMGSVKGRENVYKGGNDKHDGRNRESRKRRGKVKGRER